MKITIQRDGLKLVGILTLPKKDIFDLIILMHGFTADCGYKESDLLYQLAKRLEKAGFATLRVDFNGHGKSDGQLMDMTVLNELADGKAILDYARTIDGVNHLYLLGHSQGGVVASMLAGYYPECFTKIVLMAPAATLKEDALKGCLMNETYDPKHIPEKVNLNEHVIGGFYFRIAQQLSIYEVASHFLGPVCLVHGDQDFIVNPSASKKYQECYQNSVLHLLNGSDHSFGNEHRNKAIDIVLEFLEEETCDE